MTKVARHLFLLSFCFALEHYSSAQYLRVPDSFHTINDVSMELRVSGDGFGPHYYPSLGIRTGRRTTLEAGMIMRQDDYSMAGISSGFRYCLMTVSRSFTGRATIYVFGRAERLSSQQLGKHDIELQDYTGVMHTQDAPSDFTMVHYHAYEGGAGLGGAINIFSGLFLNWEVMISYYKSSQENYNSFSLYYQKSGMIMEVGGGISWRFNERAADLVTLTEHQDEDLLAEETSE
ncbi:MAG: hypothetical protein HY064_14080 [Bacteroidetes bacterium]|nr:hypothetical protein [Bacteroidota bacterium]